MNRDGPAFYLGSLNLSQITGTGKAALLGKRLYNINLESECCKNHYYHRYGVQNDDSHRHWWGHNARIGMLRSGSPCCSPEPALVLRLQDLLLLPWIDASSSVALWCSSRLAWPGGWGDTSGMEGELVRLPGSRGSGWSQLLFCGGAGARCPSGTSSIW